MTQSAGSAHPAFETVRIETIESLNLRVEQYEHIATGAMHYHLAADNNENVFLVALRTVPDDSTGVAHILEHTALCGSERYPVRDPFFMMLRRSLNTFMNAFTSSDWTAYPFASQNRKDFRNLLDVYLDAVFFSRLDPLDFAQEGHRLEFSEAGNPDSELVYKGVVFNEMKGAMSSISSTLWNTLCSHLFPSSTYRFNSGGDPQNIPDLSYEDLLSFYRSHYHPSNAMFMTFGDIAASEHQSVFQNNVLHRFKRLPERIEVLPERRLTQPLRVTEHYALDDNASDQSNKTHIVIAWMLGESTDLTQMLEAQLLSSVLMDNSASPLQQLLETTELGRSPSPLCGLEDSMREMVFCCGLEGSEAEHAQAFESQVLAVIQDVAQNGIAQERVEAVLHQLELHQREISGDSYPYGLQLILQALSSATHYSDPIAVLNMDPVIAGLREKIADPEYIKTLAKTLLLDNAHRVTLIMEPDAALSQQRQNAEAERLAAIKASMTEAQKTATVELATQLIERQQQEDDESILPKVELQDVASELPDLEYKEQTIKAHPVTSYIRGTNGLSYLQMITPLPLLQAEHLQIMPLFNSVITEMGIGTGSYLDAQQRQSATVGSINAFTSLRGAIDNEQTICGHFTLSSKALIRNAEQQVALMLDIWHTARFDETDRLRDLTRQILARREQSISGNGHGLAMTAACAGMSPLAHISHQQSGLAGISALRALDKNLDDADGLGEFSQQLYELHHTLQKSPVEILAITDEQQMPALLKTLESTLPADPEETQSSEFSLPAIRERRGELWLTNTQINFCARAFPTVPVQHVDAPALTVLGGFLRNGYLHRAIREQGGAYGGGASQDSSIGAFRFYSYRDPRREETLADFDAAIDWMLNLQHEARALEESILGVIGSMDKPSSPAGEAKQHFHNRLYGRTHDQREIFRQQILSVTLDDLRRVTETYLKPELASTAIVAPSNARDDVQDLLEAYQLSLHQL